MAPKGVPLRKFPLLNDSTDLCFINVVLQILRYVAEFSKRIYSYAGKSAIDRVQLERPDIAYGAVMSELRKIFKRDVTSATALRRVDNFLPNEMLHDRDAMDFFNLLLHRYLESDKTLFEIKLREFFYCQSCGEMVCRKLRVPIPTIQV